MEKYRDCFGNLFYSVTNKRGEVFSVTRSKAGKNEIIHNRPYYSTSEVYFSPFADSFFFGYDLGTFDSFVMAVCFLKNNKDYLF